MSEKRWEILNDYAKTAITVAGGLLAIGATYFGQNQSSLFQPYSAKFWVLVAAAFGLFLSIVSCLVIIATIYRLLSGPGEGKTAMSGTVTGRVTGNIEGTVTGQIEASIDGTVAKSGNEAIKTLKTVSNTSYISLATALLLIGIIGFWPNPGTVQMDEAVDAARSEAAKTFKIPSDSLELQSVHLLEPKYSIHFISSQRPILVDVDTKSGKILSISR